VARLRSRLLPLIVGLSSVALLATACAPGPSESDAAPAPAHSVDPKDFAGKTLNYVYFTDGPDEKGTRDLIAKFEKKYKVTVNLEILAFGDLVKSVQARLTGGNAPDVVRLASLSEFRDDLLPLDDYAGAAFKDEFLPGPQAAATNAKGQLIAAPSDLTINAPFINVDLFKKAGVALPDEKKPWTWDEMLTAAKKVQAATGTPYAFAMDKSGHRLSTILSQYGTTMVGPKGNTLDTAKAEKALSPIVDLMKDDKMPRDFWLGSGSKYKGANEIFLTGDTPVYLSGNWQVGQFVQNAKFDWAAAPNPCAKECGGFPGGKFMAAFKESKNPALAAEFVKFMNSAESQTTFVTAAGALPTRVDLAKSGVKYGDAKTQAAMDVFNAELKRTPEADFSTNGDPAFSGSATELVNQISAVVAGQKDLSTAMKDLSTKIDQLVAETKQ